MNRAYVRVSTVEQHEDRQIEALEKHGIDKWYIEKISGKNTNREQLQLMLDEAEPGDTIFIHDFSRLARSTKDLLDVVESLNSRGIRLISNKEYVDTSTPTGKLMLTMIGAIAEFERTTMLERQAEGIAIAKQEGRMGRPTIMPSDNFNAIVQEWRAGKITAVDAMKQSGMTKATFYRKVKAMNA